MTNVQSCSLVWLQALNNPEKIPTKQGPRILRTIGNPTEVYSIQDTYVVERGQFIDLEVKFKELEPIKKIKDDIIHNSSEE